MALRLTCLCEATIRLSEPYPIPGSQVKCGSCGQDLAVSYPSGVIDQLKKRGKLFTADVVAPPKSQPLQASSPPRGLPQASLPKPPTNTQRINPRADSLPSALSTEIGYPTAAATEMDGTYVEPTMAAIESAGPPSFAEIDRTVPAMRTPYGDLAVAPPDAADAPAFEPASAEEPEMPTEAYTNPHPGMGDTEPGKTEVDGIHGTLPPAERAEIPAPTGKRRMGRGLLGCGMGMFGMGGAGIAGIGLIGLAVAAGGYYHYSQDLPTIEALKAYTPPTVTVVYDSKGEILGEIYDQRRYVVPLDEIPDHVENAFIAAEDANFWNHGGIDYIGILRAVGRNARQGKMAQGASTITQQVTRNFLLSSEKKIERKIKEAILAKRIESVYSKEHILFLYLNQIYLGSHAYGVEAASRTYFGKNVKDITVAEAAILAGLPQRPSDYSPHRHFKKAKGRQKYVLHQMLAKGYIDQATHDAALAEDVKIVRRDNPFLEKAPHFTEYARRYLVEKYGEKRVLNEGLEVWTTCDLELQQHAQRSVSKQVNIVDQRMGFRREAIERARGGKAIQATRQKHEKEMRKAWALAQDPAGRVPLPEKSILAEGEVYQGVILEVQPGWAKVAIGDHEGIIPLAWSDWVYAPNPRRSWKYRTAKSLTEMADLDGDWKKDEPIMQVGDIVKVKVEALDSTKGKKNKRAFRRTPGESKKYIATRLWQDPEVEAAMMSWDVNTGAVRAMVGGSDFKKSQLNRTVQSKRQVGSTFKPLVYSAALQSKRITTATMVPDAPLAFATDQKFIWKPSATDEYLGNITLRRALQASRNTATVRVLESTDPGMNDDVVYDFARALGLGGPPTHTLPLDYVPTPQNDTLCPWVREHKESTICMDHYPPRDDEGRVSNTRHRREMSPDDVHMCRACDLSMGLGSVSLSMEELMRAYTVFPTYGKLVEPYYIEEVRDRNGNILEKHEPVEPPQVIPEETASLANHLLYSVYRGGTGYEAFKALKLNGLAGKTGTTNDYKDAWFVGFSPDVITAAWVGFDQPRSMGLSSTGGRTALPIWIDYMRKAVDPKKDRYWEMRGKIEWAFIDEATGKRVRPGGAARKYPFIQGTAPESTGISAGQVTVEDVTEL